MQSRRDGPEMARCPPPRWPRMSTFQAGGFVEPPTPIAIRPSSPLEIGRTESFSTSIRKMPSTIGRAALLLLWLGLLAVVQAYALHMPHIGAAHGLLPARAPSPLCLLPGLFKRNKVLTLDSLACVPQSPPPPSRAPTPTHTASHVAEPFRARSRRPRPMVA